VDFPLLQGTGARDVFTAVFSADQLHLCPGFKAKTIFFVFRKIFEKRTGISGVQDNAASVANSSSVNIFVAFNLLRVLILKMFIFFKQCPFKTDSKF
jgi:hypothetical protein